jgi:hypothetical protein
MSPNGGTSGGAPRLQLMVGFGAKRTSAGSPGRIASGAHDPQETSGVQCTRLQNSWLAC